MAPVFCSTCGNIQDISKEDVITCDVCGEINPNTALSQVTTSSSNNFPSDLRTKLKSSTQITSTKDFENTAVISRECPQCDGKIMSWSAVQLRSADEGSTIFYRCPNCGYRETENN